MLSQTSYDQSPFIVIWEVTRACALKCKHCRAKAQYEANPNELTYEQGKNLIDQISDLDHPMLVFTGGDPLMRKDLFPLVEYAMGKGLHVSMAPSATPKVTKDIMKKAHDVGLYHWAFSLDGSTAKLHDYFRGVGGSFDLTMKSIDYLNELNIPIQINTTVSKFNKDDLPNILELVGKLGITRWSVFFLIPTGRASADQMISPEEHEEVLKWLNEKSYDVPFHIKTTEAPFYRRVVLQNQKEHSMSKSTPMNFGGHAHRPVNDGKGFVFVSHVGDVSPSGFLPVVCGNIKEETLGNIYRNHPVFKSLRNPNLFKGKCGVCEYHNICGGSRARAYGVTGDYLESDPCCPYIPEKWKNHVQ